MYVCVYIGYKGKLPKIELDYQDLIQLVVIVHSKWYWWKWLCLHCKQYIKWIFVMRYCYYDDCHPFGQTKLWPPNETGRKKMCGADTEK